MRWSRLRILFVAAAGLVVFGVLARGGDVVAQERVVPQAARGGKALIEPWSRTPEEVRRLKLPEWPLPTDLAKWRDVDRAAIRARLLERLGELPPRPDPARVKVLSREDRGDHVLERFEFHNGVDALVPGVLLVPKERRGRVPAVVGLHGHGGSAATICEDVQNPQCTGPDLVRRGYVVAAVDTYFCGARSPKGREGLAEKYRGLDETMQFKLHLWQGRTLWGMMLRDQQCLVDWLQTRAEVDPARIGVTGMSMGGTGSWWLAAVDDRIACAVGVAGFTRYAELLAQDAARLHGLYYYVPGLLAEFDTEAIYALVAPRPLLMLSGDQDAGLPVDGIVVLEEKLGRVWRLHGADGAFRSVVYRGTGHEYLPEMRRRMLDWFLRHLPVEAGR